MLKLKTTKRRICNKRAKQLRVRRQRFFANPVITSPSGVFRTREDRDKFLCAFVELQNPFLRLVECVPIDWKPKGFVPGDMQIATFKAKIMTQEERPRSQGAKGRR